MTNYKHITLEIDARGVAMVGLNRPEVHNAFDAQLIAELTRVFSELESNSAVRVALLFGHGKSFCAGGDVNWMRSMKNFSREENVADSQGLAAMYARLRYFKKPLIGMVHGAALGGGSGLAAVCDFVLAAEDATFGFTETRLGIVPAVISPYAIEKIGVSAARAYFISGMKFSADIAKEIGLVHRVVDTDTLLLSRAEVVEEFLKAAPLASCSAKKLVDDMVALKADREKQTALSVNTIADARIGAEGQEGMDALLNKRSPTWVQS